MAGGRGARNRRRWLASCNREGWALRWRPDPQETMEDPDRHGHGRDTGEIDSAGAKDASRARAGAPPPADEDEVAGVGSRRIRLARARARARISRRRSHRR